MIGTLLQGVIAFILTGVIGSRIAHRWQERAAKEARFFEASKDMYAQMVDAADVLSVLVGKRLYAMQRVCMTTPSSAAYEDAVSKYRAVVIEWNERLFSIELAVRTKFKNASLHNFEALQSELSLASSRVNRIISSHSFTESQNTLKNIQKIRADFFVFTQDMMKEAQLLHRQMHFGVLINYDLYEIDKMSTYDLIKSLFTSRIEGQTVVRSPSDFGLPVSVGDARFGINEQ